MACLNQAVICLRRTARLLSLVVAGIVCSSHVDASCGDYLHTRTSHPEMDHTVDRYANTSLTAQEVANVFSDVVFSRHPNPQLPCSEPGCRQSDDSAPPPVALTGPNGQVRNAGIATFPASIVVPGIGRSCESRDAEAVPGFPALIYIPPECDRDRFSL